MVAHKSQHSFSGVGSEAQSRMSGGSERTQQLVDPTEPEFPQPGGGEAPAATVPLLPATEPLGGELRVSTASRADALPSTTPSVERFLKDLASLGWVPAKDLADLESSRWTTTSPDDSAEVESVAQRLIDRGMLSEFQARAILAGRAGELVLGHYIMVGKLGQGGMGIVYDAYDTERQTHVALKVLPQVDPASLYRFKREFRAHADLSHPNLIKLYELFSHDDRWYYTMEKVVGLDFLTALQNGPSSSCDSHDLPRLQGRSSRPLKPASASSVIGLDVLKSPVETRQDTPAPVEDHRLRSQLRQLVEGLIAVHRGGLLHRDIKPSNVLVRSDGQVVILDFGLVTELVKAGDEPQGPSRSSDLAPVPPGLTDHVVVGTVDYMAPEQAAGRELSCASDWYSVGVILYQALTGTKPFTGSALRTLTDKQQFDPPAPRALVPTIPVDLDELCGKLLSRRPEERPGGHEILDRLDHPGKMGRDGAASRLPAVGSRLFVGRSEQLALLRQAYESVRAGGAKVVCLSGPSGVGKSSLVEHFLESLTGDDFPLVLGGRCFEQESVPFKALDSLIDALTRYLRRAELDLEAILPESISALAQIFPTLRRVDAIAARASTEREILDPQERRRRAFEAFRSLLTQIAQRTLLVLAIDDLQWGDVDSAHLLTQLLLPPNPPRLLLLASTRSENEEASECLRLLREGIGPMGDDLFWLDIPIEPLTEDEARALAAAVLDAPAQDRPDYVETIVHEGHGNPYLICELARHNLVQDAGAPLLGKLDLNTVLNDRINRLPEGAQRLLEVIAIASRPVSQRCAYQAAGLVGDAWSGLMALRSGKLARSHGLKLDDEVVAFHDRIREIVVDRLPAKQRQELHRRLALSLEESSAASEETLASHFLGAGFFERAGMYYERAADRAVDALAFDRAARLYDQAKAIRPLTGEDLRSFLTKHADALACAGRGAEAARLYLQRSDREGPPQALELRRKAAYQLCITGRIDEGRAIWQKVLAEAGFSLAATPRRALLGLLRELLLLKLSGYRFRDGQGRKPPAVLLERLDLLWAAGVGLGMFDVLPAHTYQLKGLRESLRSGDPYRASRTLASAATILAYQGSSQAVMVDRLLTQSEDLARRSGQPHALGIQALMGAFADLHLDRLDQGMKRIAIAQEIFARDCRDVFWEIDTTNLVLLWLQVFRGDFDKAERDWAIQRIAAQERGDLYAQFSLEVIVGSFLRLNRDEPEEALDAIDMVMRNWSESEFKVQHLSALEARCRIDRYLGRGKEGFDRLMAEWPVITRSLLFRSQFTRTAFLMSRACAAIQAAAGSRGNTQLLSLARRDAKTLRRERWPRADALAATIDGSADALEGRRNEAIVHFRDSARFFEDSHAQLPEICSLYRLAEVTGGIEGRELQQRALERFRSLHVRDPIRTVQMITGSCSPES
jgi:serine/threonine protein kinase